MNPVAARSKAYVCGRSLGGIAGSNFAGGWTSVSVNVLCCDGQILRPEESDRVWCVCVSLSLIRQYSNPLHLQ